MTANPRPEMPPPAEIAILHLEDSDLDAQFVKDRLEKSGLCVAVERVGDRKGFVSRLERGRFDLILSDYQVPTFEGLAALDLAREHQPDTPFIFVSGTMGEELAVETLKRGATDYVLKDRLARLPAAVERALAEAREKAERRRAEEERERLFREAQEAKVEAEAANRMKDEFLATLSHELRTPLNAIVGWTRILRSSRVDDEDREEGLEVIDRNARAQAQLIDDLLDISRIISGKLTLDVRRVDLRDVIEGAIAAVLPAADAKGVRIQKVLDSLTGQVSGDPNRLQQVVWNLVTNAVKFTPRGGHVQVLLERVNSHVEVSVIDTGQGIRPDFLPHVFDRFRQADGSTTRSHGGLGLGLSIVKQLVEMHGGSVRVKSPGEGQGTTFVVALPIVVVHPDQAAGGRPEETRRRAREDVCGENHLGGLRVLVVDDEPDARTLMKRVLDGCGAEVATAGSVKEAVALVEGFRPDILVSDIGMPEQDGYDLIHQVRRRLTARELPAAALTAFARSEDRMRAMRAGFQVHVAKPVDPDELVTVVATLASRTGGGPGTTGGNP